MPVLLKSRIISLEHVYATQNFGERIEDICKIDKRADFASALVRKDPLACSQIRHVEECVIFCLRSPRRLKPGLVYFETHAVALLTVIQTLPCTIKSLSLQNIYISNEFFMALQVFTNLESLALSDVTISSKFVSNQSTIVPDLKSFSLFLCAVDLQLPARDGMKSLSTFLNLDSIRTLKTDNIYLLDAIVSQCKTLNMMRLEHYSNITI
jgi:hypothetical protein